VCVKSSKNKDMLSCIGKKEGDYVIDVWVCLFSLFVRESCVLFFLMFRNLRKLDH